MKCLHTVFALLTLFILLILLSPLRLFIQNGYYAHTYNRAYIDLWGLSKMLECG